MDSGQFCPEAGLNRGVGHGCLRKLERMAICLGWQFMGLKRR